MRNGLALLIAFLVTVAVAPAGAAAATVRVGVSTDGDGKMGYRSYAYVEYEADPGETNSLTVTGGSAAITVTDEGAPIAPGERCTAVDAHTVRCVGGTAPSQGNTVPLVGTRIETHDGADRVDLDTDSDFGHQVESGGGDDRIEQLALEGMWGARGASPLSLNGGSGDDTILSGPGEDRLTGGAGSDHISGGGGPDRIYGDGAAPYGTDVIDGGDEEGRDTVLYGERTAPVRVDLASPGEAGAPGEGDRITRVENVIGGAGGDEIRGDAGPNDLIAGDGVAGSPPKEGLDVIDGREGNDTLSGSSGDDSLNGGTGNDSVTGYSGNDRIKGGAGDDRVGTIDNEQDSGYSRISCGTGQDQVHSARSHDLIPRDCEQASTAGGLAFVTVPRTRINNGRLEILIGLSKQVLDECDVRALRVTVSGPYHRRTERATVLVRRELRIRPRERRVLVIPLDRRVRRVLTRPAPTPVRLSVLAPYECTSGKRGDHTAFTVEL